MGTKHVFLSVLAFTFIALFASKYLATFNDSPNEHAGFPWEVTVLESGNTQVFSVIIGETSLLQAEKIFHEAAEITLFSTPQSEAVVEAFFSEVKIGGLKSKMVMSIDIPQSELQAMFSRGARISTLGSGTRKITLSSDDAQRVRHAAIRSITYLPAINLNAELIEKRFGQPQEKLADPESDAIHWLYPDKGVDIALSDENKEVIQYVTPEHFAELTRPLKTPLDSAP